MTHSNYYSTLSGDVKIQYDHKIGVIHNIDPYALSSNEYHHDGFSKSSISTHSFYTGKQMKAYESLQAFKQYESCIQKIAAKQISEEAFVVMSEVQQTDAVADTNSIIDLILQVGDVITDVGHEDIRDATIQTTDDNISVDFQAYQAERLVQDTVKFSLALSDTTSTGDRRASATSSTLYELRKSRIASDSTDQTFIIKEPTDPKSNFRDLFGSLKNSLAYKNEHRFAESVAVLENDFDYGTFEDFQLDEGKIEKKELIVEEEAEVEVEDLTPYYEKHDELDKKLTSFKCVNFILQKKLAKLLRRRKVVNFLLFEQPAPSSVTGYNNRLDTYGELINQIESLMADCNDELETLTRKRDLEFKELNSTFQKFLNREREIGIRLIFSKTGNTISEKLIDKLIKRQRTVSETISEMRQKTIRLREMICGKEKNIADLDVVEEHFRLGDYETLKFENRVLADKNEERQEEEEELRKQCIETVQVLAHHREKLTNLKEDVQKVKSRADDCEYELKDWRSRLSSLKQEKDYYRSMTHAIKGEAIWIKETELIYDMGKSLKQRAPLEHELAKCKNEVSENNRMLANIRKYIEKEKHGRRKQQPKKVGNTSKNGRSKTKGSKISIVTPVIHENPLIGLVKIRPSPMICTKERRTVLKPR